MAYIPVAVRFPRFVMPEPNSGCHLWIGGRTNDGYGLMGLTYPVKRQGYAHVIAWELEHGPVPEGHEVDHLCRVHSCVNPAHLEPVTKQENIRRYAEWWNRTHPTCAKCGEAFRLTPKGDRWCGGCARIKRATVEHRARDTEKHRLKRLEPGRLAFEAAAARRYRASKRQKAMSA